jgi:cytochrome b
MAQRPAGVRVWDLPTRVFHWLLAALVVFSWLTGQWGGSDWREWHFRSGYVLLALLLFRIVWGFIGPRYARFASFPPNPVAAWRGLAHRTIAPGHAPPGALSVYAMLAVIAAQVVTGLFATDGSYSEGPWARLVSHRTVDLMTSVHVLNRWLLLALVLLHAGAVVYYAAVRREALLGAMLHGNRTDCSGTDAEDGIGVRVRAMAVAAIAAAVTVWAVTV